MKIDGKRCAVIDFGNGNKIRMFPAKYLDELVGETVNKVLNARFDSSKITDESRIKHNMEALHLTPRQLEIHDFFMASSISTYPQGLLGYLTVIGHKYGLSGDVMAESIAAWIRGDEDNFPEPGWKE